MLLDTGLQVYLWVGKKTSDIEIKLAFKSAQVGWAWSVAFLGCVWQDTAVSSAVKHLVPLKLVGRWRKLMLLYTCRFTSSISGTSSRTDPASLCWVWSTKRCGRSSGVSMAGAGTRRPWSSWVFAIVAILALWCLHSGGQHRQSMHVCIMSVVIKQVLHCCLCQCNSLVVTLWLFVCFEASSITIVSLGGELHNFKMVDYSGAIKLNV